MSIWPPRKIGSIANGLIDESTLKGSKTTIGNLPNIRSLLGNSNQINRDYGRTDFTQVRRQTSNRPEYKIHVISQVKDQNGKPIRVSAFLPENISVDYSSDYKAPFDQSVFGDNLVGNLARAFGNSGIVQEMTFKVWENSRGLSFDIPLVFVADDEYSANSEENSDIILQILKLNRLCAPYRVKGSKFLQPPGPNLKFSGSSFSDAFSQSYEQNLNNEITTDEGLTAYDIGKFAANPLLGVLNEGFGLDKRVNAASSALASSLSELIKLENVTSVYIGDFLFLDSVNVESVSQQYDMILGVDHRPMRCMVNFRFTTSMVPTIEDLYRYFGKSSRNIPKEALGN